jgi:hypothetical protein
MTIYGSQEAIPTTVSHIFPKLLNPFQAPENGVPLYFAKPFSFTDVSENV